MFARTPAADEDEDQASLDMIVSHKLHLFWRGAWHELWTDAGAVVEPARSRASPQDDGSIGRIEALVAAGKTSRATALACGRCDIATGPRVVGSCVTFSLLPRAPPMQTKTRLAQRLQR